MYTDVAANDRFTITLPSAVEGLHYKFIINQTTNHSIAWTTSTYGNNENIYGPSGYVQGGSLIQYENGKQLDIIATEQNYFAIYELIAISSTTWLLSIGNLYNGGLIISYSTPSQSTQSAKKQ